MSGDPILVRDLACFPSRLMEKEAVDDYRNSCLSNENIRKFLLRLGGEYLCYAARQGFSDDEGSSAILWALVKASLRCLEAVRHVSQDSLCLEVVQAECLISKIVFKYFGDTAGALSRIETVISTIRASNLDCSTLLFEASSFYYELLSHDERKVSRDDLHRFLNRSAREALSARQVYWYYYFMNKRAELLCSHSSVEELYSLLDTMEKEAEEVGSRDLKSVVMLNAVETALRYLLVRRADYALRAISNFIHFDPFDTRDPLWVSLDFFQNSNTAQKVTVLDRIKLKLALTAAVYCICKRDVETAHKHLQRLSECLSIIKSRVYQLFYRDDYKISPNIFNELLKISAVICLLSGVCSRERDTQESNFYFYRCLEITKQAKESIRQMDIRSYSMHKIEDLAVWLSTFDFTVRRHIMASYIASSDGVSALNSLQAINSDPRVSRCSARFFRRLNLNMAQVYKSLGLDLAALHHFGLSISNNDPESSFIAYSSISSIYILNPTLERSNMVTPSLNKLQEYIHNLGNFGVVQSEVTSTLFALLHFSRMDILKAKSCALDVLRLYGHKICHNTSLVCLSIVGLLYLDPVPEEARKIFATAKKLSTSLQTIPFIYLSAKCISYASRRIGNLPETDADLRDISLLRSKLNDTNLASIELLRRLEDSYTPS